MGGRGEEEGGGGKHEAAKIIESGRGGEGRGGTRKIFSRL